MNTNQLKITTQSAELPKMIQAQVSARILTELPRMFDGGLEALFKEAFQNAHRAGARQVTVYCDHPQRMIVISDDGCGISNPEVLLHAGATGWDERAVIEPAGLGIFSYLNHDVVESVLIRSGAFNVRLDASVLHGAVIPVLTRPCRTGTRLCFELTDTCAISLRGIQEEVEKARAYYPFAVRLVQRDSTGARTHKVIDAKAVRSQLTLDLAVGTIRWCKDSFFSWACVKPVWAHVPVEDALTVLRALERAAEAHPRSALAKAILRSGYVVWDVDPACGVRPKLPDRKAIQASPDLDQAACTIVSALVEHFWHEAWLDSATWPDRLMEIRCWDWPNRFEHDYVGVHVWFADHSLIMDAMFDELGWHEIAYADYRTAPDIINTDDDLSYTLQYVIVRDRTVPVIGSRDLVQTLNLFGHPVAYAKGAPIPALFMDGLQVEPSAGQGKSTSRCDVALASRIEIQGFGTLPALVPSTEWCSDWDVLQSKVLAGIGLVFAGDLRQLIQTMKGESWVEHVLLWWSHNGDSDLVLGDYLGSDTEVAWEDFRRDVLTKAAQAFEPALLSQIEMHYALKEEIARIQGAMGECQRSLKWLAHAPEYSMIRQKLDQAIVALKEVDRALRQQANQLAQILGLD